MQGTIEQNIQMVLAMCSKSSVWHAIEVPMVTADAPNRLVTKIIQPGSVIPNILGGLELMIAWVQHRFNSEAVIEVTANGITIVITTDEPRRAELLAMHEVDALANARHKMALRWEQEMNHYIAEWEKTDEYQQQKQKREEELIQLNAQVNELIDLFPVPDAPTFIWSSDYQIEVLCWTAALSAVNDHRGLTFDKQALADRFEQAGFKRNANALTQKQVELGISWGSLYTDDAVPAFLIGQAIDMLRNDMPVHPLLGEHIVQFFERVYPTGNRAKGAQST